MLRTDTGNFNRFLTSLGLLLMAAALLIPYFYFRDTDVLRISQSELRGLTPTGRESLEARQRRIGDLEIPIATLALLLGLGGATTLVLGGRRLRVAQGKEDEAIDRRARRETYEIQALSTDEVEEEQDERAQEVVDEEASGPVAQLPVGEEGLGGPPPRLRTHEETRQEIARIEEEMGAVLARENFESFTYRSRVKIVADSIGPRQADVSPRQVNVDGLFEAKGSNRPDVALELKVTRLSVRSLKPRAKMFTDALLALLARYNQVTGREVLGWLLILVPRGADRLSGLERQHVEQHFEQAMAGLGKCTVLHEEDLVRLPQIFRENFG